ncbi:hypothetical protein JR316_0007927 [Psilocybe cubensis]|uniref:Uncharacterized protein n=2 Tax=Psilocybe cubensis TaxID=181762 RepID=A0ACB8GVE2_PSICU|nr:hypothetical protein JR316_0007927 [Psilocybe cubensis]KAH9479337.1 hypothetical protein JR316_0007927 [Psilocybe cubensis]
MDAPAPEKRRLKVTVGALPSSKIASLAASHPFSQQIDVVFPSDPRLVEALRGLEISYVRAKARLVDILHHADVFATSASESDPVIVCSNEADEEDVWCVDPRGHLSLSVTAESYQRLGLLGQKLPFKNQSDRHVIDIPLRKNAQSAANQAKQKKSLENWDERRGLWNVIYSANSTVSAPFQETTTVPVQCEVQEFKDILVPTPSLSVRPEKSSTQRSSGGQPTRDEIEDMIEDWDLRTQSLFEWVGMACLGAQRLRANDRVDPYVAVYEPLQPSQMQDVTHIRWRGLLSPGFVKRVIDTVCSGLQGTISTNASFIAITCQALSSSPVSYIPYTTSATGTLQTPPSVPLKLPRKEGEDTWSLIIERPVGNGDDVAMNGSNVADGPKWCLVESLGQWDARWG